MGNQATGLTHASCGELARLASHYDIGSKRYLAMSDRSFRLAAKLAKKAGFFSSLFSGSRKSRSITAYNDSAMFAKASKRFSKKAAAYSKEAKRCFRKTLRSDGISDHELNFLERLIVR